VPGQVESDDAETLEDVGIVEEGAVLTAVAPGRVKAEKWHPLPCFLNVEAVRLAQEIEPQVAPEDRLEARAHAGGLTLASTPLK
jgi:hypothetical protein